MALLTLGGLELDGFEVPASVRFGGAQRAAVHKLLGGARVIDTMGRDDSALSWSGILSGADASDRARTLDALRVAGGVLALAWDAFCYDVVITQLDLEYRNPWWITYSIECTVLSDLAQSVVTFTPDVAGAVIADVTSAAAFVNLAGVLAAASVTGALLPGASGIAPVIAGLTAAQAAFGPGLNGAEASLAATSVPTLVGACGALAQLSTAQGFVGRALANLSGVQG